ncbi:MAG TPA: tRNA uridine(34) 5-carboxymethylaminomethyl modification radical SAM/GNAT enzyme Elp3 [archaeon]|nr:tRNA uridine(34) 5-carboxymethylaminomethyl modification radical SAM/GNAT enzyme Elp3 [archaeon]
MQTEAVLAKPIRKFNRTISGVAPVTVITRPQDSCRYGCIYCPVETKNAPKSYTDKSPQVLRALHAGYDPAKQIEIRLKTFEMMGHSTDKVELLVMGGTFAGYPQDYQNEFIKGCYDGLNGFPAPSLEEAKKINETAKNRMVAMCIENRPDLCTEKVVSKLLDFGATRIELGVQNLDDDIYRITKRGHTVEDVTRGVQNLRDAGFKVGFHMMLGLPGSTPARDLDNFKALFADPRFKPDQLKIYPTFVVEGTELEKLYKRGEYHPYDKETMIELMIKIKQLIPRYTRVMKIMRDIPADFIVSSCKNSHLRDEIQLRMRNRNLRCDCIRCREVGHVIRKGGPFNPSKIELRRIDYDASDGKEIFLSFEDMQNSVLVGLLRLRIPGKPFRPEITPSAALIREIHVYGTEVPLGTSTNDWQHRGYGTLLMREAERIAKEEFGKDKMVIISGVGVKRYFIEKFGYNYDGPYVSKQL